MTKNLASLVAHLRSTKRRLDISHTELIELFWRVHPRFQFLKSLPWGWNVLDLGAGNGGLTHWRSWLKPDRGDLNLYGVDRNPGEFRELYAGWETLDLDREMPNFGGVDVNGIIASHLIEYLDAPERLVAWLGRRVKSGTRAYLEWTGPSSLDLPTRDELSQHGIDVLTSNFTDDREHKEAPDLASVERWLGEARFSVIASGAVDLGILGEEMFARATDRDTRSMGYRSLTRSSLYTVAIKSDEAKPRAAATAPKAAATTRSRIIGRAPSSDVVTQPPAGGELHLLRAKRALLVSGLFDAEFYRATYADMQDETIDPLTHYLTRGEAEGRSPNTVFAPRYYRRHWMKGLPADQNALLHYVEAGERGGAKPHPAFEPQAYLAANPPLAEFVDRPLFHYLAIGRDAGLPVEPGARGAALARVLEAQRHAIEFESSGRRDGTALQRYKDALVTELGEDEGDALYTESFDLPNEAEPYRTIDLRQWQTAISLESQPPLTLDRPIGIFLHLFYDDLAEEIARHLSAIGLPKRIYVSTSSERKQISIRDAFERYGLNAASHIAIVPNQGLDIAPLLIEFRGRLRDHDICLKLHGKKSLHTRGAFGDDWRSYLFNEVIGNGDRVRSIVSAMTVNPELGVLMPNHYSDILPYVGIGPNYDLMQSLLQKLGIGLSPAQPIEFPSGSMFWFRSDALYRLTTLGLDWPDFGEPENGKDGTLAHALERCILFSSAHAGKKWAFLPPHLASGGPAAPSSG